ncbi:hypothetical protein ACA910_009986 [Epithemia clementina (nom. ined.)]
MSKLDDGWDDDDLSALGDDDDEAENEEIENDDYSQQHQPPPAETAHHQQPPQIPPIYHELRQYFEILPHLPSSINALLEAEHNSNPEKAWDLVRYYQERPGLADYTLKKELPRMHYTWMDPFTGEPIQDDKAAISHLLLQEVKSNPHSILPRCANQSLLADLMEYLSSSSDQQQQDGLIQQRFHMASQTERVEFILEPADATVLVKAVLQLCLPHPSRGMLPVASLRVSCQFAPNIPLWHYHLESIVPSAAIMEAINNVDQYNPLLLEVSHFLQELTLHEDVGDQCSTQGGDENFRDAFLHQTAMDVWNQIKLAGRVSSQTLSNHFSLPSDDLLEQARLEEEEAQAASLLQRQQAMMQQQQQQRLSIPPPPPYPKQDAPPTMAHPQEQQYYNNRYPTMHKQQHPPPPPPPPPPPQADQLLPPTTERPKSILGGMISRLAQSVTALPHEDPSMYDEWRQPEPPIPQWPGRPKQQPGLAAPPPPPPMLSQKDPETATSQSDESIVPPPPVTDDDSNRLMRQQRPDSKGRPDTRQPAAGTTSTAAARHEHFTLPGGKNQIHPSFPVIVAPPPDPPAQITAKKPALPSSPNNNKQRQHQPNIKIPCNFAGSGNLNRIDETTDGNDDTDFNEGWDNDDGDLLMLEEEDEDDCGENREVANNDDECVDDDGNNKDEQRHRFEESDKGRHVLQITASSSSDPRATPTSASTANVPVFPNSVVDTNRDVLMDPPADSPVSMSNNNDHNHADLLEDDKDHGDWEYDSETDIIPTRKRWINPRPGPRLLSLLKSQQSC